MICRPTHDVYGKLSFFPEISWCGFDDYGPVKLTFIVISAVWRQLYKIEP